jgi:23S rRNA pseudouridine1911/1915/1917 synthase
MKIEIIAETNNWIAISKPAGIQVERNPFGPSAESLVYDYLSKKYRNPYVGIVHRIDRPTSGLVLVAKKERTVRKFNRYFASKKVKKQYLAKVSPPLGTEEGVAEHWLLKDRMAKKALLATKKTPKAKFCKMAYKTVAIDASGQHQLLLIEPATGRYHQIRAQLAALGSPIIGDSRYGSELPHLPDCITLHACQLEIEEEGIKLVAEWPDWSSNL